MHRLATAIAACLLLEACGTVGDPLYPSLNIPVRVTDLRAVEHADKLLIDFSIPHLTTDGVTIKTVRDVELMADDKRVPVNKNVPGPVHVQAPVDGLAGKEITIHVRLVGTKGHASDWSNSVTLRVVPPLAAPSDLKAEGLPEGVKLTWSGTGEKHFVIYRDRNKIGESDTPEYVDKATEYGKTYQYSVQAVNGAADSDPSQQASITTRDIFPPAVPSGLTATRGINTVEVAWNRNTEPDFKGYRVYRATGDGPFARIADMLEGPSFSDPNVSAGNRYRYTVSAVDQSGNESAQCPPVEITVE